MCDDCGAAARFARAQMCRPNPDGPGALAILHTAPIPGGNQKSGIETNLDQPESWAEDLNDIFWAPRI